MDLGDVAAVAQREAIDRIAVKKLTQLAVADMPAGGVQEGAQLVDACLRPQRAESHRQRGRRLPHPPGELGQDAVAVEVAIAPVEAEEEFTDRKSTRLNSSH